MSTIDASPVPRTVRVAGEVVLLGLVALSPWPFGSVEPAFEFLLCLGVFTLAALWAAHAVLTRRFSFRPDVVSVALAGLVAWTAVQLLPLPEGVVAVVSPGRADWHRTLLPQVEEVLPGEAGGATRTGLVPLSVNPAATRALLARLLGLLVVYAAARNWLADRDSLPRLMWVLVATGVGLATLAVGQAAGGRPNTGYGLSLPVTPFGPFINRNHYADFVALCAGGGLGLLLTRADGDGWLSGRRLGLVLAVGFMVLSVPPSLSRGGTLAVAAAGVGCWLLSRVGRDDAAGGGGRLALAAAVGLAAVAAVTLGTSAVESRLATLGDRETLKEGRADLWRDALRLVPGVPLAGTGGGTFELVEPAVRSNPRIADRNFEYAHNEYVEALVEGGAVRLGFTLLLAGGTLWAVGRGAVVRRDRSVGGPLLGLWAGLAAVALHAVTEFAVHTPAVAVAAAVVAGYAVAAAADNGFVPHRVKVRKKRGRGGHGQLTEVVGADPPVPADDPDRAARWVGRGPVAVAAGLGVAAAALLVVVDADTRRRATAYELAAVAVGNGQLPSPTPTADRIRYAEARAAVRPDDPAGRILAAEAHIQAAFERAKAAGGPLTPGPDVSAAVAHLRAARRAAPVAAKAHARLGLLAGQFAGEPAAVHFARAKRLLPGDPEVWFASGREAFARGDRAAALADWRQSLGMSTARLADVLAAVKGTPAAELRDDLLPPEPTVLVAAADGLFPDRLRQADDRRPFLAEAVKQAKAKGKPTADDWVAGADAADQLGRAEVADECWVRAVEAAPTSVPVRDAFTRWLEREERYEQAIEQLRQLQRFSSSTGITDRIEGCRHALDLKRIIGD